MIRSIQCRVAGAAIYRKVKKTCSACAGDRDGSCGGSEAGYINLCGASAYACGRLSDRDWYHCCLTVVGISYFEIISSGSQT